MDGEEYALLDCPLLSDREDALSVAGSSILDSDGEEDALDVLSLPLPSSLRPPSPSLSPPLSPSPSPTASPPPSHPRFPPTCVYPEQERASAPVATSTVVRPPFEEESSPPTSHHEQQEHRKSRVIQLNGKRKFRYVPDELPEVSLPKLALQKTHSPPLRPLRITRPSLLLEPKRLRISKPSDDLRLTIVANRTAQISVIPRENGSALASELRGRGGGGGGERGGDTHPSPVNALAPFTSMSHGPSATAATFSSPHTLPCTSSSLPPGSTVRLFNKSPPFLASGLTLSAYYTNQPTFQPSPPPSPPSPPPPAPSTLPSSRDMSKNPFLSRIQSHRRLLNPFVSALSEHKHNKASSSSHLSGLSLTTPNQHFDVQHQCRDGLFSQPSYPSPPRHFSFSLSQITN